MDKKRIFLTSLSAAACLAALRSGYETSHLKAVYYSASSSKLPEGTNVKIVFLTDLHCRKYGERNIELLRLVRAQDPDLILAGGDMVNAEGSYESDNEVLSLLKALKKIAPVYFALGNHEEYLKAEINRFGGRYKNIEKYLEKAQIPLLANSHIDLDNNISLYGLEISRKYYRRFNNKAPKPSHMEKYLGKPDKSRYNILLAHDPAFFNSYETWKGDLVLSGHYHGGIVRLPFLGGVISPYLTFFPDYCVGEYEKNDTKLIVSAGCGCHDINFRLFNMPEVSVIELHSEDIKL